MKNRKEIAVGFTTGIIANTLGTLLYVWLFSDLGIAETFCTAIAQGYAGSLLALGALLNLIAFFGFLFIKRDNRAKGVLFATLITALIILFYKMI